MTYHKDVAARIRHLEEMLHNIYDLYMYLPEAKRINLELEFDVCVNGGKLKILKEYPDYYKAYKHILRKWFPKSYSIKNVKGITTLCQYLAINCGIRWPYSYLLR